MNRTVTIELDWDEVDKIVVNELKNNLEGFIDSPRTFLSMPSHYWIAVAIDT